MTTLLESQYILRCQAALVNGAYSLASPRLSTSSSAMPFLTKSNILTISQKRSLATITKSLSSLHLKATSASDAELGFSRGEAIQVEVMRFGRLGASVEVIGKGHREEDIIDEDEEALASGLILQKEIHYFRQARGIDVVVGEILPAYVENVRSLPVMREGNPVPGEFRKSLDICLREVGGRAKAETLGKDIMERLSNSAEGTIGVGDKSSPEDINELFPGASKSAFKKAVAMLFRQGKVIPKPYEVSLSKNSS